MDHSRDVEVASAQVDGVRHPESIVVRQGGSPAPSASFLEVRLDGRYRRLTAVAGVLDDAAEPFQIGHFEVWLDGTRRWTGTAAVGQSAVVAVDVAGATRLRLVMHRAALSSSRFLAAGSRMRAAELAWVGAAVG